MPIFVGQVLLFFGILPFVLYSQRYLVRAYSVSNGISSTVINDITQDKNGVMWFATTRSITSYDGTKWKNYYELDNLPSFEYSCVKSDNQGNTWAFPAKLTDCIYIFKDSRWLPIKIPKTLQKTTAALKAASVSMDGNFVGIGTTGNGFYFYNQIINQWIHSPGPPIFGLAYYNGSFFLATESGLFQIKIQQPNSWIPIKTSAPSLPIYAIAIETNSSPAPGENTQIPSRIWIVGKNFVGYYSKNQFKTLYNNELPGFKTPHYYYNLTCLPDRMGGTWIGSHYTFSNIDKNGKLTGYGAKNGLLGEGAAAMFKDRESNLWVGNLRGVSKIISFRFETFNRLSGLYEDEVTAVNQLGNGRIVCGHNGGITILSPSGDIIETIQIPGTSQESILDSRVMDMYRDRKGDVWAAVNQVGIAHIPQSGRIQWYKIKFPGVPKVFYTSISQDIDGSIIASANQYLLKFQNNRFIPIKIFNNSETIRRIYRGTNDIVYIIGAYSGIYQWKHNRLTPLFIMKNRDEILLHALYEDREENLLVGTNVGLYILKDHELIKFQNQWFELNYPVYFITEDRQGNLWFGTNNGVIRWDGRTVRHFTPQDGLAGTEANRAAGFVDNAGRMWIGTDMGMSCYRQQYDITPNTPPSMELIHIEASGKKYPPQHRLVLNVNQTGISFSFRGISLIDESAVRYNFKLEGFDTQWTTNFQPVNNQVIYTNLLPGNYRFFIQALNAYGIESDIKSTAVITINPPFQINRFFNYMLPLILFFLLIIIINTLSRRRYMKQLEKQFMQRTRQLESSEKELREIFNTAHDAIIIFSPAGGTVLDVNKRACDMYGFTRPEFVGMSLDTISKDSPMGQLKITESLHYGDYLHFETIHYRKNGSEMVLEVNASVINYRGKTAILSLNRDITERKSAEHQIKQSLSEKEILLKEIHHRVKNNLQIISSLLDLQSETQDDPTVLQVFQDSRNRIRSMALVHENLYLSVDLARIDSSEYLQSVADYFFATYGNMEDRITPNIQVENILLDMDTAIPIGLILTELLSNALKHAFPPNHNGTLFVRFRSQPKGFLTLTVRDNGIGLPDHIDLKESKSLGLQLVTLLSRQLKGKIEIIRKSGTTFKLTFPFSLEGRIGKIDIDEE